MKNQWNRIPHDYSPSDAENEYIIYLFKSPDCIRGWLAYIEPGIDKNSATYQVKLRAETGAKAKNKAITAANNNFKNVEIIKKNYNHSLWGINNFPELLESK